MKFIVTRVSEWRLEKENPPCESVTWNEKEEHWEIEITSFKKFMEFIENEGEGAVVIIYGHWEDGSIASRNIEIYDDYRE